ncbi:MAG TPA: hypothetical protein ENK10_01650 [Acidobacteria bacterium]|nr:hypothetical protein [Acidobacteriota bacterium]
MTELAYLPGPLYPDLFQPERTPSLVPVAGDEPRWRAEVLEIHHLQISADSAAIDGELQQAIDELVERHAPARWDILGSTSTDGCHPMRIVQVGLVHRLEVAADDSHQALEIAQAIAAQRWPGSELLGVDLVLPGEGRG